jgi:hypothetical protein
MEALRPEKRQNTVLDSMRRPAPAAAHDAVLDESRSLRIDGLQFAAIDGASNEAQELERESALHDDYP